MLPSSLTGLFLYVSTLGSRLSLHADFVLIELRPLLAILRVLRGRHRRSCRVLLDIPTYVPSSSSPLLFTIRF